MFLHLGGGVSVLGRDILVIADYAQITERTENQAFWSSLLRGAPAAQGGARRRPRPDGIIDIAGGAPRSVVLTAKHVYLSAISSVTLMKRAAEAQQVMEGNH